MAVDLTHNRLLWQLTVFYIHNVRNKYSGSTMVLQHGDNSSSFFLIKVLVTEFFDKILICVGSVGRAYAKFN